MTKDSSQIFTTFGFWFANPPHFFENIVDLLAFRDGIFVRWFGNSLLYAGSISLGRTLICAWERVNRGPKMVEKRRLAKNGLSRWSKTLSYPRCRRVRRLRRPEITQRAPEESSPAVRIACLYQGLLPGVASDAPSDRWANPLPCTVFRIAYSAFPIPLANERPTVSSINFVQAIPGRNI